MKKYNENELTLLGTSPKALIAKQLGCTHNAVSDALKNGKGSKRKTGLYLKICDAADIFLATTNSITPLD